MERVELSPFGVEIRGIDLSALPSQEEMREIQEAWNAHQLLVFRDQDFDGEAQLRFIRQFGEPLIETMDGSSVSYVSNVRDDAIIRKGAIFFHSDLAFTSHPLRGISLFAVDAPGGVAPTRYANAILACERLPQELRRRIEGLRAVHTFDLVGQRGDVRYKDVALPPDAPRAVHPVVWSHPVHGRPILYVNLMQTDRILDLPEAEAAELLEELLSHLYRPENVLEHRWRPGDFVFWDNWALQHARPDSEAKRTLRRVVVGEQSVAVPVAV